MLRITIMILASMILFCAFAEAKTMVGVYYFPGWYRTGAESWTKVNGQFKDWSEWRGAVMKAAYPRALAGFSDDSDPTLWDYYNRWMTSSGIDFIAFDWYYNDRQEYLSDSLDKGYLASNPSSNLKFCLHWCNHGGSWWRTPLNQSEARLTEMIDVVSEKYFRHPNYLHIDGKPVFMIYEHDTLSGFGDVKSNLAAMRKRAQDRGLAGLYIVGVYSGSDRSQIDIRKKCGYDAFCAYTYAWMRGPKVTWDSPTYDYADVTDNIVSNLHPYLARVAKAEGITYWPSCFSGWDDRPRAGLDNAIVLQGNTPDQFGKMFQSALRHVDPKRPIVIVEAWNEWGEGACIEPSKEHGFGYLQQMADALGVKNTDYRIPTKSEIASWSILTPAELVIAKENESKPWPVRPVKLYQMGESRIIPDIKMPVVIDFSDDTMNFALHNMKVESRNSTGLTLASTGGDPQIEFPIPEIATHQVKRITIEVEILEMPPHKSFITTEIYVATALLPEFCPFTAVVMPQIKDGKTTQLTSEMIAWSKYGTPITKMRIDPCHESGARVLLKRVILE